MPQAVLCGTLSKVMQQQNRHHSLAYIAQYCIAIASVRPFVTLRYCIKTAKYTIEILSLPDSLFS